MALHKDATGADNHALPANPAPYADVAARDADTAFQIATNVDKLIRVDSPVSFYILASVGPAVWDEIGQLGGSNSFLALPDTPSSFAGNAGKVSQVNAAANALEFGQALRTTDSPTFADLVLTGNLTLSGTVDGVDVGVSVPPNTTHRTSDGKNHADVVLNNAHRVSNGSDHAFLDQAVTIAGGPTFASLKLAGQLIVGGTVAPAASASIDLKATDKALLNNRLTTTQRDALTAVAGMQIYNTTLADVQHFDGVSWNGVGGGDVSGPPSATDNALARFNATSGKNIQNSLVSIDDAGAVTGLTKLTVDDLQIDGNTISSINNKPISILPAGFNDLFLGSNIIINGQSITTDADMLFRSSGAADKRFKFDHSIQVQDAYEINSNLFTMVNVVGDRVKLGQLNFRSQSGGTIDLDINIDGTLEIGGSRRFTFSAQEADPAGLRTIKPLIAQGVDTGDDYTIEAEVAGSVLSIYSRRTAGTAVPGSSRYVIRFSGVGDSPSNSAFWTHDGTTTSTVTAPTIFWPTALISQLNLPGSVGVLELGTGSTPVNVLGKLTVSGSLKVVNVYEKADLPGTLVAGTNYVLHAPITLTTGEELTFPGTGVSEISSTNLGTNILTYTGTGTLLQGTSIESISLNVQINSTGTGTLFGITGSGSFAFIFANSGGFSGWDDLGTITSFGAVGMNFVTVIDFDAGLKLVTSDGFFLTHSNWFNFSDSGADFLTFDANIESISIISSGFEPIGAERVFNINSSANVIAAISNVLGPDDSSKYFNTAGLDKTSPGVIISSSENIEDSTTSAELSLTGNTAVTAIPLAGAMVEINLDTNWADDIERMTLSTDGVVTYIGLSPVKIKVDANINLEPSTASKSLSIRTVKIAPVSTTITFTNATNLINETATALVDGDTLSFRDTVGTLPAEIRKDVVYFVVSKLANSFQVSYTSGGAAVVFTDDGTPVNSYKVATLRGSSPTNTITAASPRDLIPQSAIPMITNSKAFLVVINNDDAVDIKVNSGYQRYAQ